MLKALDMAERRDGDAQRARRAEDRRAGCDGDGVAVDGEGTEGHCARDEVRRPKTEGRKKAEARRPKSERGGAARVIGSFPPYCAEDEVEFFGFAPEHSRLGG